MKRALIICNDFPPLNSIGAERPYSWFQYFKKYGIDVTVVTKIWQSSSPSIEHLNGNLQSSDNELIEILDEGQIIKVPHRLTMPEKIVLKFGMKKFVWLRKALTFFFKILSFISFRFDKHAYLYQAADNILQNEQFDFLITTSEPFVLFRYGYLLKKKYPVIWIADYRDGWYLNHETRQHTSLLNRILRAYEFFFERKYMRLVDAIQSVDPLLTKSLGEMHDCKKTICIYNGFRDFYAPQKAVEKFSSLLLTHTGTLTTGQRIELLLNAIIQLHEEGKIKPGDLILRMVGLEFYSTQLNRVVHYSPLLQNYLVTTPRLSREKAMDMNYESDYCISLTDPDFSAIYAKTYDYIACSTPIILIPNDHSLLEEVINRLNAGITIETVEELKTFLLKSIEGKKGGAHTDKIMIDKQKAWFYSRENQARIMTEELFKLLN